MHLYVWLRCDRQYLPLSERLVSIIGHDARHHFVTARDQSPSNISRLYISAQRNAVCEA
jgi:hypothetical protein